MTTREIKVQRFSITSRKPFDEVIAVFEKAIGHPDMEVFREMITATRTAAELQKLADGAVGPSGLMEFMRFDLGEVLRKEQNGQAARSMRFVVGNPVIMKQMVKFVPDAGSYAPVTILIDERPDGVHLTYDRMASFLAPYENHEAIEVAVDLDSKVERVLVEASN